MSPRVRAVVVLVVALVGFGVVLEVVDRLSPQPKGPRSSSYATSPSGLAAYASVLERAGHPVRRLRTPIAERAPRDGETLIVLDPDVIDPDEARAIGDWVRDGGRLVAGGSGEAPWLEEVIGSEPRWDFDGGRTRTPLLPVTETAGVRQVRGVESGAWHDLGPTLPVIGPADAPLVITTATGSGSVALIADPSPLHNRALDQADNAALGLALVGGEERPVAFLETVHGYGVSRGFGGLPARVKWVLLGLALTTLVALWSVGRRFGPTEDPDTPLPPPRVEYVDALAAALARAKPEEDRK
jgi:Domain of unknown function (DUF4350)